MLVTDMLHHAICMSKIRAASLSLNGNPQSEKVCSVQGCIGLFNTLILDLHPTLKQFLKLQLQHCVLSESSD